MMSCRSPVYLAIVASLALTTAAAQAPVRGVVRIADGAPVTGANVFVLETLDGALTGADGRFTIATTAAGSFTLVVKRLGFESVQRVIEPGQRDSIVVVLTPGGVTLSAITVQAGAYTAGEDRGATLTPLEVVTTPGTAADVNRTIQTLPGVQPVDEGTGLFVRGGDYTETRVFLNDAPFINAIQLLSPSGTFVGTVDPFLLDGIFFSSGGFGARYGDALSAVAGLRTRGTASHVTASAGAGLAAFSADAGVPVTNRLTVRAAANRFDLHPFIEVNGSPRRYDPPPRGRDLSGSVIWDYQQGAQLKLFAVDQTNHIGVGVDDPAFSDTFNSDVRARLTVANWRHVLGSFSPSVSLSDSRLERGESFGAFRLANDFVQRQAFGQIEWQAHPATIVRFGGEVQRLAAGITGSIPEIGADRQPGARTTVLSLDRIGRRTGAFAEIEWRPNDAWRFIPGVRTDRSTLTDQTTVDPRFAVAWRVAPLTTITGAWGIYHQVPDPLFYDDSLGAGEAPAMRATQTILGLQVGEENIALRVELYAKRYRELAQLTQDFVATTGGVGRARGVDAFIKVPLFYGMTMRSTMSFLSARRTDPNTGTLARAPFDISSTKTLIVERPFASLGLRLGVAYRSATGRPVTPVNGAQYDPQRDVYFPQYGAPMSERLPAFRRVDLSISHFGALNKYFNRVLYLSLSNIFDRENVYAYRYSRDYTTRIPVRSIFNRAIYVGASLLRI
jgi:hypothetical protein